MTTPDGWVVDDHLLSDEIKRKLYRLGPRLPWTWGSGSNRDTDRPLHWGMQIAGKSARNDPPSCETEMFAKAPEVVIDVWRGIRRTYLPDHVPYHVYVNAHTLGVDGYHHHDAPQDDGRMTAIVYLHDAWEIDWGGELICYTPDGEVTCGTLPWPGRVVVFPSHWGHRATSVTRLCPGLRLSLMFKTLPATKK